MPGYSGTPLATKLGIEPGSSLRLVAAPEDLPLDLPDGVTVRRTGRYAADVVMLFTTSYTDLAARIEALGKAIHPDGALWVAWPKRASGVPTDITEQAVRDVALPLGLVDNKVCAVTDVWSGLRLVWRRERR